MKRIPSLFAVIVCLFFAETPSGKAQVLLDFETSGQYAAHFRNIGIGTASNTQTNNGASNDFVVHNVSDITFGASGLIYDTTPGDTGAGTQSTFGVASPLAVSFDFRSTTATSSVGIYFADPSNTSNNILALFNIDQSGATDRFRFFRDGAVAPSVAVSVGTQVGSTVDLSTGLNANSGVFGSFGLALSVSGSTPTLQLTVGSQTVSQVFASGDFNWANTTVVLRLFDNNNSAATTLDVDNFAVSAVPEPSSWALLLLGGLALLGLRRAAWAGDSAASRAAKPGPFRRWWTVLMGFLSGLACVPADAQPSMGVYLTHGDEAAISRYEAWVGSTVSPIVDFGPDDNWTALSGTTAGYGLDWAVNQWASSYRSRVVWSIPMLPRTGANLADGAAGSYDQHWRNVAAKLVSAGYASNKIRIGWEFNGTWFTWSVGGTGYNGVANTTNYRNYWKKIVLAMRSVPGANFKFVWCGCPGDFYSGTLINPSQAYPDADANGNYVDEIGIDVYDTNWTYYPIDPSWPQWQKDSNRTNAWTALTSWGTYPMNWWASFAASKGKPLVLPEWGLAESATEHGGGDNTIFMQNLYAWMSDPSKNVAWHSYFQEDVSFTSKIFEANASVFPQAIAKFLELYGPATGSGVPSVAKILNAYTGKSLRPYQAGTADNVNLVQYAYNAAWSSEQWQMNNLGNGYYSLVNAYTGKALRPLNASTTSGANVVQYAYDSSWQSEQWELIPNGAGYYGIRNRYSSLALRPLNAGTADDVQIVQQAYDSTWSSMRWQIAAP